MTGVTFITFAVLVNSYVFVPFAAFALLTLWYYRSSSRDYDYTLTNRELEIAVIRAKSSRKTIVLCDFPSALVVLAPSKTKPVERWKGKRMPTFDCTSHTGAPYYCMILKEENASEVKVLFEPNQEMLESLHRLAPQQVHIRVE